MEVVASSPLGDRQPRGSKLLRSTGLSWRGLGGLLGGITEGTIQGQGGPVALSLNWQRSPEPQRSPRASLASFCASALHRPSEGAKLLTKSFLEPWETAPPGRSLLKHRS